MYCIVNYFQIKSAISPMKFVLMMLIDFSQCISIVYNIIINAVFHVVLNELINK